VAAHDRRFNTEERDSLAEAKRLLKFVDLEGLGDNLARNLPYGARQPEVEAQQKWRRTAAVSTPDPWPSFGAYVTHRGMQAGHVLATALAAIGFVAAAFASLHALLNKRRPQSAFGWIAICLTLPLLGALLYYLFGINRVQTRARKLLTRLPAPECPTEYVGTRPSPYLADLGRGLPPAGASRW